MFIVRALKQTQNIFFLYNEPYRKIDRSNGTAGTMESPPNNKNKLDTNTDHHIKSYSPSFGYYKTTHKRTNKRPPYQAGYQMYTEIQF